MYITTLWSVGLFWQSLPCSYAASARIGKLLRCAIERIEVYITALLSVFRSLLTVFTACQEFSEIALYIVDGHIEALSVFRSLLTVFTLLTCSLSEKRQAPEVHIRTHWGVHHGLLSVFRSRLSAYSFGIYLVDMKPQQEQARFWLAAAFWKFQCVRLQYMTRSH